MNQNNQQDVAKDFDLLYYIDKYLIPLLEYKWYVICSILIFTAFAVTLSLFIKPEFSSTATMQLGQLETDSGNIGRVADDPATFAAVLENMRSSTFRTKIVETIDDNLINELELPLAIPGQIKVKLSPFFEKYKKKLVEKVRKDDLKNPIDKRLKEEKKKKQVQITRLFHRMKINSNRREGTIRITGRAFDPTNAFLLVVKYIELWEKENLNNVKRTILERLDIARSQLKQHQGYLDEAVREDFVYRQERDIPIDLMVVLDSTIQIKINILHHAITRATDNYNNVNIVVQRLERLSRSVRNNIIVINPAQVPLYPSKDKRMVIILIGIILGIVSGTLPVLAWEYYRGYIRHEKDIEDAVGIPVIGRLPTIQ